MYYLGSPNHYFEHYSILDIVLLLSQSGMRSVIVSPNRRKQIDRCVDRFRETHTWCLAVHIKALREVKKRALCWQASCISNKEALPDLGSTFLEVFRQC